MAKEKVYGFDEQGFRRVRDAVRRVLGSPRTGSQRRRQPPIVGDGGCASRNEIWELGVIGTPTGGTFDLSVRVNDVTETVTINYDDTAAEVKTALATHSEITSSDIETGGGPLPDVSIGIEFIGDLANTNIVDAYDAVPTKDISSLTGGTSPGVWIHMIQLGYAG